MSEPCVYILDCDRSDTRSAELWTVAQALQCSKRQPQRGDRVRSLEDVELSGIDGFRLSPGEEALVVEVDSDGDVRLQNPRGEVSGSFWVRRHFAHCGSKAPRCTDRAARVGDTVKLAQSELLEAQNGFYLSPNESATIVEIDGDGDFKLRDPRGVITENFWQHHAFAFTRLQERASFRLPSGICFMARSVQTDDEDWLSLGDYQLPLTSNGCSVVKPSACDGPFFLVDNAELGSLSPGLTFRRSPTLDPQSKCHRFVIPYGSVIAGELVNEDWLKVADFYLPFKVKNCTVIKEIRAVKSEAVPYLRREDIHGPSSLQRAQWTQLFTYMDPATCDFAAQGDVTQSTPYLFAPGAREKVSPLALVDDARKTPLPYLEADDSTDADLTPKSQVSMR